MVDLDDKVEELTESWINGNISWVFDQIGKMKRFQAAYVSVKIAETLSKCSHGAAGFIRILGGRAEE